MRSLLTQEHDDFVIPDDYHCHTNLTDKSDTQKQENQLKLDCGKGLRKTECIFSEDKSDSSAFKVLLTNDQNKFVSPDGCHCSPDGTRYCDTTDKDDSFDLYSGLLKTQENNKNQKMNLKKVFCQL